MLHFKNDLKPYLVAMAREHVIRRWAKYEERGEAKTASSKSGATEHICRLNHDIRGMGTKMDDVYREVLKCSVN